MGRKGRDREGWVRVVGRDRAIVRRESSYEMEWDIGY